MNALFYSVLENGSLIQDDPYNPMQLNSIFNTQWGPRKVVDHVWHCFEDAKDSWDNHCQ